jgi:Concanavalin A-like lectin/glucanases superfamily/Right handed beta helix region
MPRLRLALACARTPLRPRTARRHVAACALALCLPLVAVAFVLDRSPAVAAAACNRTATPATFGANVAAAGAGQTVCLTSGNYGTWGGTNKAITITAAPGNTPTMQVSFGSGDGGFTVNGMSGMGGVIDGSASNITIQNSRFATELDISGSVSKIMISHNDLTFPVQSRSSGPAAKIYYDAHGGSPGSAATIAFNDIENGDLDGLQISGGSGLYVVGNVFRNLCDRGVNHTDNIQFVGGSQITVHANYVYEPQNCPTQGITSYDGNTNGLLIEDNVVDVPRDWGIELYSDRGSVVMHNTVVYHPSSYSEFHTSGGQIDIDRKSQDPAGSGTQVYNNIASSVDFQNGSSGTQHNNVSGQRALYVGPTNTWAGFKLATNSPVGLRAASDGLNAGARISGAAPPPPPTGSKPPTPKPPPPTPKPPSGNTAKPPLVVFFKFDEASGSTVIDRSGFHNNGTIHGATRTPFGRQGRALRFDGSRDYVSVPNSPSLNLVRGMTLGAWVRPVGTQRALRAVLRKARGRGLSYGLYASGRRGASVSIRTRRSYTARANRALRSSRWSYLAATYDGKALRVYVNGVLVSSHVVHGALKKVRGPLTIGAGFKGVIDDVCVWRGALSVSAIRTAMFFTAA